MAVSTNADTRLGCGRDIDELWARIGQPPDAHERGCPDCRRAREALAPLAQASTAQREADENDPELAPGPQVLTRVMETVRAEVRRGRRLPLDEPGGRSAGGPQTAVADRTEGPGPGDLTVSEQTVVAAARRAADGVAGVQVRRCRVELATADPASAAAAGSRLSIDDDGRRSAEPVPNSFQALEPGRVTVTLQISIGVGVSIPSAGVQIRRAVDETVFWEVGLRVAAVHIDVRDVHDA